MNNRLLWVCFVLLGFSINVLGMEIKCYKSMDDCKDGVDDVYLMGGCERDSFSGDYYNHYKCSAWFGTPLVERCQINTCGTCEETTYREGKGCYMYYGTNTTGYTYCNSDCMEGVDIAAWTIFGVSMFNFASGLIGFVCMSCICCWPMGCILLLTFLIMCCACPTS